MSWAANAERRRAFRVVRFIKARRVYLLRNSYGLEFEEPLERLEQNGYRIVQRKPAYGEGVPA